MQKININNLAILLIFSAIYLTLGIDYGINTYDEGVAFTGASQILNNEMPYSDFWTLYAPGQFFLNAATIKLLGHNLINQRIFSIILQLLIVFYSYLIIKKSSKNGGLIGGFTIAFLLGGFEIWGRSILTSIFLSVVALYYFLNAIDKKDKKDMFFSIFLLGLNILFRHLLGGVLVSFFLIFLLFNYKTLMLRVKHFFGFVILSAIPFLSYLFIAKYNPHELFRMLIYNPLFVFSEYRDLPLPSLNFDDLKVLSVASIIYISWLIPQAIRVYFFVEIFRKRNITRLAIMIFVWVFAITASVRTDLEHLMPSLIFSVIFLFSVNINSKVRIALIGLILLIPIQNKMERMYDYVINSDKIVYKYGTISESEEFAREYNSVISLLIGKKFFSCGSENDRIVGNDVLIYYMTGAEPDYYFLEMHPGITTFNFHQYDIIQQLGDTDAILAIKNEFIELNKSSEADYGYLLDNYIEENFYLVQESKNYKVLYRKQ